MSIKIGHKRLNTNRVFEGDRVIWVVIVLLSIISLVVVTSSTASMAYKSQGGNMFHFFISQLFYLIIGLFVTWYIHKTDFAWWRRYSGVMFSGAILLMLLTFVIGVSLNGASRWLRVPVIGITFQPSDVVKISLVLLLARELARRQKSILHMTLIPPLRFSAWSTPEQKERNIQILLKNTLPILLPTALACGLILISNFSTCSMIFICTLFMLFVGRVRVKEIFRLVGLTMIAGALAIALLSVTGIGRADTWKKRLISFVGIEASSQGSAKEDTKQHADELQVEQAKIAIASGGILGKGPGNSTQRTNLPHSYSDFAYAFIVEEYGLVGGITVLLLYLCLLFRVIRVSKQSVDSFSALAVLGLGLTVMIQAMVNMCVSTAVSPVTGQTLPLISKGGSSLVFTSISLGLILCVSRQNALREKEEERRLKESSGNAAPMSVEESQVIKNQPIYSEEE